VDSDLVNRIAEEFLSPYWKERLKGSSEELLPAFSDQHLRALALYPAAPIEPDALVKPLREQLGERVSINVEKQQLWATITVEPVTAETVAHDLGAVKEMARQLGTHTELQRVEQSDAAPDPTAAANVYRDNGEDRIALRISVRVPLKNDLLFGAPSLPLPPVKRGNPASRPHAVNFDERKCPHCDALHVIAYGQKSHSQDRDDIDFACLACGRIKLVAWGIPELVQYHIDLADRLPPALKAAHARQASQDGASYAHRDWDAAAAGWVFARWNLLLAVTAAIPAIILVLAWLSEDAFRDPVFRGARTLATLCCAVYALSIAVCIRTNGRSGGGAATIAFAATFATMIPVVVALNH